SLWFIAMEPLKSTSLTTVLAFLPGIAQLAKCPLNLCMRMEPPSLSGTTYTMSWEESPRRTNACRIDVAPLTMRTAITAMIWLQTLQLRLMTARAREGHHTLLAMAIIRLGS